MGRGRCVKGPGMRQEAAEEEDRTLRQCAVTRTRQAKERLLRLVSDPQGQWTVDLSGRLPGRGVHVQSDPQIIRRFLQRRGGTTAVEPLLEQTGQGLTGRVLDGLGLARRAASLRRGLRDVTEGVEAGERPLIVLAADTAVHTRQKLSQLVHRHPGLEVWELLDRERLGLACGNNGPVAVLGVTEPRMAKRVRNDLLRWRDFFSSGQ
jgi:predicted RNA-binding protein YlxR (DUF448 family)/ribosomal protein L7Ae-like RNA K-turn-binding protein